MLVKGKAVIGLNVVTIDTGTIVQTVKDIAYNPNTHRVEALFVKKAGVFAAAKAIHMDDVINIGQDAVIVHDASVIKSVKEINETIKALSDSKKYLVKTNVLTATGKELGKVTDIYFDSESGNVSTMEVSQGGLKTITEGKKSITPSNIVTIGADATIVSTYTEMVLEAQGENAGLKGAVNDAKHKAAELTDDIKDAANEAGDKIKATSQDVTSKVKKASDDFADTAEKKAAEAQAAINTNTKQLSEKTNAISNSIDDSVHSATRNGRKVIQRTTETYEDAAKEVELKKTKIIKRK